MGACQPEVRFVHGQRDEQHPVGENSWPAGEFNSDTTSGITDLAAIARDAGIEHAATSIMEFGDAVIDALARHDLSVIVAKVAAVGPNDYGMDLHLPENAFRFKRCIAERKAASRSST